MGWGGRGVAGADGQTMLSLESRQKQPDPELDNGRMVGGLKSKHFPPVIH